MKHRALPLLAAVLVLACEPVAAHPELAAAVARRLESVKFVQANQDVPAAESWKQSAVPDFTRVSALLAEPQSNLRRLQGAGEDCDSAFLDCLKSDGCVDCFVELQTKEIDWATVSTETPCADVTKYLFKGGHCRRLENDRDALALFCETFDTCVAFEEEENGNNNNEPELNCHTLTKCEWEGKHEQWLGDGICHDGIGCYNSEACGYDDGDCCPDTCKTPDASFVTCGHEGYVCRDPNSANCDKSLNPKCVNDKRTKAPLPTCREGTTLYRMVMYDSFGDGWDGTRLTIADKASINNILYTLDLAEGSQGTEYICLNRSPACYHVEVKGGVWGREVSWEVKPMTEGGPTLASGGSPMACDFGVAGDSCINTCTGRTTEDPTKDPDYKEFKTMSECISEKCPIQIGACQEDKVCVECFRDIPADYCYADAYFNALLDCAICKCTDSVDKDFCASKLAPSRPVDPERNDDNSWTQDPCSPAETVKGGNAVLAFGKCTDMEEASMMVTDFDQNNFGMLDKFEECAHSWKNKPDRGGHTALGCLQILLDAKNGEFGNNVPRNAPREAIQALAAHLYDNPHEFCECASQASIDCPLCPSFMNFKTLLYEAMDACQSLDEIDCDAWKDFFPTCRENLNSNKGGADFSKPDQCSYVKEGCGGAGAFPVFRNLNCDKEVSDEAWSFYLKFAGSCLDNGPVPPPTPVSPPTPSPVAPAPDPSSNNDDYVTPVSPTDKKPYVPPEDRGKEKKKDQKKKEYSGDKPEKKSHFLRNMFWLLLIGGGCYYYYKTYGFDFSFFQRYRRFRPVSSYDQGGGDMYSGLTMESSTNFQPPTLPPTPMDMGGAPPNNGGHYI